MDHFNGRGGGVLPLYRDAVGIAPNIAPSLLKLIAQRLSANVTAEDFLAYVAGTAAHLGYTERFAEELKTPGVRIPLTADKELWAEAVALGREVLWLHTYGERYADPAQGRPAEPPKLPPDQRPKVTVTIPDTVEDMPEEISYNAETQILHVGAGEIHPVLPQVWAYEVSGMNIVKKWFGYRKKNPAGRRSSPLDGITPERWPARFTTELLELLNVLGRCVDLEPRQADVLARVCAGPLISITDLEQGKVLPVPSNAKKPLPPESPDMPTLLLRPR
jgi:hypothetical protein